MPVHRGFVLGGRGTLTGDPFRAWGGRAAFRWRVEWGFPIPFPALQMGGFAATGTQLLVAPFAAMGWAWQRMPGVPWLPSEGGRPVGGVAVEWLHGLVRTEVGYSLLGHRWAVTVDLRQDLWGIL